MKKLFFLPLLGLLVASVASAQREAPKTEMIDGDLMYHVLPPDRIPAIFNPEFASSEEAAAWMHDDELVLGVLTPDGNARAYSAWHLDSHEIVNDVVGEVPIAVTW